MADDTRSELRQRVKALALKERSAKWALAYALLEVLETRSYKVWGYRSLTAYVIGDQILSSPAASQYVTMARTARAAKPARREWMERQCPITAYKRTPVHERQPSGPSSRGGSAARAAERRLGVGASDEAARVDRIVEALTDATLVIERGLPHKWQAVRSWFERLRHAVEVEGSRTDLPRCEHCGDQSQAFDFSYRRANRFVCTRHRCRAAAKKRGRIAA